MFSPTPRLCATSSTVRSPRPSSKRTASALNSAVYRFLFKFFFYIQQTLYRRDDLPAGCPLIRLQLRTLLAQLRAFSGCPSNRVKFRLSKPRLVSSPLPVLLNIVPRYASSSRLASGD